MRSIPASLNPFRDLEQNMSSTLLSSLEGLPTAFDSCAHEVVLLNRKTFHMSCHGCGAALATPCFGTVAACPATPLPSSDGEEGAAATAKSERCSHMLTSTHPVTDIVTCLLCNEVLTTDTFVDSRGVKRASRHDPANILSAPQHLAASQFQTDMSAADSYAAAFEGTGGPAEPEWNPYSGAPCPHAIKTTDVRTGKMSCCMCRADLG